MIEKYRNFFLDTIDGAIKDKVKHSKKAKKLQDRKEHTIRVVKLCAELSNLLQGIDCNMLISAAWIHDVGKTEKGAHHLPSVLKKAIPCNLWNNDIFEIVKQHRKIFDPKHHKKECAILRLCDKIDKFYDEEFEDVIKKCGEVLQEIKNTGCFEKDTDYQIINLFYKEKEDEAKKQM